MHLTNQCRISCKIDGFFEEFKIHDNIPHFQNGEFTLQDAIFLKVGISKYSPASYTGLISGLGICGVLTYSSVISRFCNCRIFSYSALLSLHRNHSLIYRTHKGLGNLWSLNLFLTYLQILHLQNLLIFCIIITPQKPHPHIHNMTCDMTCDVTCHVT